MPGAYENYNDISLYDAVVYMTRAFNLLPIKCYFLGKKKYVER